MHAPSAAVPAADAKARYGFAFTESAKAVGIDFTHEGPTLDPKLAHIMPQVASMGAGLAIVDVDADGHADLYVTNSKEGSKNRLYRNKGDGTFEDIAERVGLAALNQPGTGVSMGSVWGDYDNDGFEDVIVYKWGKPELFHNDGGKAFTSISDRAGLPAWANINAAVWLDFDRDGKLDLFLGGYFAEQVNLWNLASTKMMPESFEYANNGGRKFLYRNLGGGRFEEVSEKVGLSSRRWALAAVAADLRDTGYPDLFIANDYGVSELFINEGGKFREVGKESGVGYAPKSGMNASVGDVLNQGTFAVYVSNISEEGILIQGNNLWVPTGGTPQLPTYENMARAMGVDLGGWSFGAQFGDLNNDGFLDLYLVNGYVSASKTDSYWYDYSKIAGGHEVVISDAKNWPPMGTRSLAGYQAKKVWLSDGAGPLHRRRADGRRHRSPRRPLGRAGRLRQPRRPRRGRRQPARTARVLPQRRGAGPRLDRLRPDRPLRLGHRAGHDLLEPQRHRRPGDGPFQRPAAGAGGPGRLGLLRAEPAAPPFRPGREGHGREGHHPLAFR